MKIAAIIPFSTVDEIGKTSVTIFTSGCNLDCPFCHNHKLIDGAIGEDRSSDYIVDYINDNARFVKCVVISGGEPTIQQDLFYVISEIKSRTHLPVYVNSNGTRFEIIRDIASIADGISIDLKTLDPVRMPGYNERVIETVIKSIRYMSDEHRRRPEFKPEVRLTLVEPMIPCGMVPLIVSSLVSWSYSGYVTVQEFDRDNVREECLDGLATVDMEKTMKILSSLTMPRLHVFARTLTKGIIQIQR
jgi:pyruvate formate lyase activating enzyme